VLVARTKHVPGEPGAVYVLVFPLPLMLPQVADHMTLVSPVPVAVAVNVADSPSANDAEAGTTDTLTDASSPASTNDTVTTAVTYGDAASRGCFNAFS